MSSRNAWNNDVDGSESQFGGASESAAPAGGGGGGGGGGGESRVSRVSKNSEQSAGPAPLLAPGPAGSMPLGAQPVRVTCPHCRNGVTTINRPRVGALTWLLCIGLCCIGCWPCSLIPFCVKEVNDVDHGCPNCRKYIGTYKRVG